MVTRTMASLGCSMDGTSFSSTRTLYGPRYTIARIRPPPGSAPDLRVLHRSRVPQLGNEPAGQPTGARWQAALVRRRAAAPRVTPQSPLAPWLPLLRRRQRFGQQRDQRLELHVRGRGDLLVGPVQRPRGQAGLAVDDLGDLRVDGLR